MTDPTAAQRDLIAQTYGIPAEDVEMLGTGIDEQMAARAERLADLYARKPGSHKPVEQLTPGARPTQEESDDLLYQQMFGQQS